MHIRLGWMGLALLGAMVACSSNNDEPGSTSAAGTGTAGSASTGSGGGAGADGGSTGGSAGKGGAATGDGGSGGTSMGGSGGASAGSGGGGAAGSSGASGSGGAGGSGGAPGSGGAAGSGGSSGVSIYCSKSGSDCYCAPQLQPPPDEVALCTPALVNGVCCADSTFPTGGFCRCKNWACKEDSLGCDCSSGGGGAALRCFKTWPRCCMSTTGTASSCSCDDLSSTCDPDTTQVPNCAVSAYHCTGGQKDIATCKE